jgi:hypothetical protein
MACEFDIFECTCISIVINGVQQRPSGHPSRGKPVITRFIEIPIIELICVPTGVKPGEIIMEERALPNARSSASRN